MTYYCIFLFLITAFPNFEHCSLALGFFFFLAGDKIEK